MKKFGTITAIILSALIAFGATACGGGGGGATLRTSKSVVFIEQIGATDTVTASIGAETANASWKSDNSSVATVNGGVITAAGLGQTVVTASANGKECKIDVLVGKVEVDAAATASVSVGETADVSAELKFNGTAVDGVTEKYESSNKNIATVDENGVVTGAEKGTVVITVSGEFYGRTFKNTTDVSVNSAPKLTIAEREIVTAVGHDYTVGASLTLDGVAIPEATFDYSMSDNGVATVDASGKVSGVKKGSAVLTVNAHYSGKDYSGTVNVTVNNDIDVDVALNAANVTLIPYDKLPEGAKREFDLVLTIEKDGAAVTDKTVEWSVLDEGIVDVAGNGYTAKVTAEGLGTTQVIASFEHNGEKIEMSAKFTCVSPVFDADDITIDASKQEGIDIKMTLPSDLPVNDVTELVFNGRTLEVISRDAAANSVTVKDAGFTLGESDIVARMGVAVFNAKLVYGTMILKTKEEYYQFCARYKSNKAGEYYVLGADIDFNGEIVSEKMGYLSDNGVNADDEADRNNPSWHGETFWQGDRIVAWYATIDGRGYALKNALFVGGMFSNTSTTSVIKNLAMIDCINIGNYEGAFLLNDGQGIVTDCYVKGELSQPEHFGLMATQWETGGRSSNIVMVLTEREGVHGQYVAIRTERGRSENLFAVCATRQEIGGADGNGILYRTVDELNNAGVAARTLTSSVWSVRGGQLYFGNHRVGE